MAVMLRVGAIALCVWLLVAVSAWVRFTLPPALVGARAASSSPTVELVPGMAHKGKVVEGLNRSGLWPSETLSAADLRARGRNAEIMGPPQPLLWRHIATVVSAKERYVLLRSEKGELKTIKEHELLPSGERLEGVQAKSVIVLDRAGKKREIKTYAE